MHCLALAGIGLEKSDEICAVLLLLEPGKDHLGALDVLLGVEEIFEEGLVAPGDAGILVGCGVGEALDGAALAAEETPEIGTLLGTAPLLV